MSGSGSSTPTKIDNRSQLIYALTEVTELEHLLMCQYLFAAASLKTYTGELVNEQRKHHQIELIRDWKRAIYQIAREEMQHLAYANNLLISVGGAPNFARPNFPCTSRFYKSGPASPGLELSLEPFSLHTIERFVRFETSEVKERDERAWLLAAIPDPNYYETLHDLYLAIRNAFTKEMLLDPGSEYDPVDEGEDSVRLARRPPIANVVRTVEEAQKLIDQIMVEGEGALSTTPDPQAHVNIFRRIRDELSEELKADPKFEPARPVASNPLTRWHDDIFPGTTTSMTVVPKDRNEGLQHRLLQLFNGCYEILLFWLTQLFARRGSPAERRAIETLVFLPYMSEVIRPVSELLTQVPVELGKPQSLGASFEVTSNNFLLPSDQTTNKLTLERLREIEAEAQGLIPLLETFKLERAARELGFLRVTFRLLIDEFVSRSENGWPPRQGAWDPAYSETGPGLWMRGETPRVLELEFQGWFQCRLATDPDGAFNHRGCTGNTFAIGDEPDLDRVIRLQPHGATVRSHCPAVGVTVTSARLLESVLHAPRSGTPVPKLVGARVNLLGEPKFEGRNHLVSEDGEPIQPFHLLIEADAGIRLSRQVRGIAINDMSPAQRRGSGRYPVSGAQANLTALRANLLHMGDVKSPQDLVRERIEALEQDYAKIPENQRIGRNAEEIRFRIKVFTEANWNSRSVRWTRFFFDCEYLHTLSGDLEAVLDGIEPKFRVKNPTGDPSKDNSSKWLIQYHVGFYDSDSLCAYMYGLLRIPVELA